jgi:hypothetical protein
MGIWIEPVHPSDVRTKTVFVRDLLERGHSRNSNVSIEEQIEDAEAGKAVIWLANDGPTPLGVCVTRILNPPPSRAIEITTVGGRRAAEWIGPMRDMLRQYRRAEGADRFRVIGRKGWARIFHLQPIGYLDGNWIFEDFS